MSRAAALRPVTCTQLPLPPATQTHSKDGLFLDFIQWEHMNVHLVVTISPSRGREERDKKIYHFLLFFPPPFCLYQTVIEVFNSARMEKQCQFLLEPPPPIAEIGNPPPSQGWKVFLCQSHHTSAFSGELSHPTATHCQNLGIYSKHPGLHQGLMKPKTTRYTSRA